MSCLHSLRKFPITSENLLVQSIYTVSFSFSAVTAIDTSGIDMLRELRKMLEKRSLQVRIANQITLRMPRSRRISANIVALFLQLVLINPVGSVMEKLHQSKVLESFRLNGLYLTIAEAVSDISSLWKAHA